MSQYQIAIIGAGPAGIAAAIQLKRYGFDPIVFEKNQVGGLLANANLVENYPGFPDGIRGNELVELMKKQLANYVETNNEDVTEVDYSNNLFSVISKSGTMQSKVLIIATGTKHREFSDIEIPKGVKDKVIYEIKSILNIKGKTIAIIGAGDAAFDYALNLAKSNNVIIINRNSETSCLPLLEKRASQFSNIAVWANSKIREVIDSKNNRIQILVDRETGIEKIETDYLIPAIGREPNLDILSDSLKNNSDKLRHEGTLYYIGDVKNDMFRQTAISVGDGIHSAMEIYEKHKDMLK